MVCGEQGLQGGEGSPVRKEASKGVAEGICSWSSGARLTSPSPLSQQCQGCLVSGTLEHGGTERPCELADGARSTALPVLPGSL